MEEQGEKDGIASLCLSSISILTQLDAQSTVSLVGVRRKQAQSVSTLKSSNTS